MGLFKSKNTDKSGVNRSLLEKDMLQVEKKNVNMDDFDLTFDDDYVSEKDESSHISLDKELEKDINDVTDMHDVNDTNTSLEIENTQEVSESAVYLDKKQEYTIAEEENKSDDTFQTEYSKLDKFDDNYRSADLKNYILYIISDKTFPGMLSYFRHYGSKVTKIFSNLSDAKDVLLMQLEPCKIVIIDSGTGKFTSMSARKSLMDLLSISDDENRIAIFYTDSVIKSEARNTEGVEDKDITWHLYKNTAGVLAVLLQNLSKENYVYDMKVDETFDKSEELLNMYGATPKKVNDIDIGLPILTLKEIYNNIQGDDTPESELTSYKVKI